MDIVDLILAALMGGAGALIGGYIMWNWLGPRIVNGAIGHAIGPAIYNWLTTPSLDTGKKRKVQDEETGEVSETNDIISPLEQIMREAGRTTYTMLCSRMGVDARKRGVAIDDVQTALGDPNNPLRQALGAVSPKLLERAFKDGDYVAIALQLFQPQIEKYINTKLANATTGGAGNGTW